MNEQSLKRLAPTVAALLGLPAPQSAAEPPLDEPLADLAPAERVAVLAPDALGWYPFGLWRHEMPYLDGLHKSRSMVLRAVMPTITPVNFSTMLTGAEKADHGVGTFNDNFVCETLFDVLRREGHQSAGVGQKGYTGGELLGRFADLWGKAESNTDAEVEEIALRFATEQRPKFMIVQLGTTDDVFHKYGPTSREVLPVVRETDERLRRMVATLKKLGYAVLITADHGQHDAEGGGGSHGQERDEDALVPLTWL